MLSVKLFLKEYDRGGENERMSERVIELAAVPAPKQYLLVKINGKVKPFFVSNSYMTTDLTSEITAYVFATATSAPYQEAVRVGIGDDEASLPSLEGFYGQTVSDLIAFFSEYPAEYGVMFNDDQVLVAKAKSNLLVLRLDDRSEHQ